MAVSGIVESLIGLLGREPSIRGITSRICYDGPSV